MSFDDFLTNRGVAAGQLLRHSVEQLPRFAAPTKVEAAEILTTARRLAAEIGRKFDAEIAPVNQQSADIFAEMQRYWTAPVPWGSLPTPPPAQLYVQLTGLLQQARGIQQSYEADANLLAEAGAGELKDYLALFIADTEGALKTLGTTNMAAIGGSSANWGAPPGPDPQYNLGTMMGQPTMQPPWPFAPSPMHGAPMPVPPMPTALPSGFDPGAAYRQQQEAFAAQQAAHQAQTAAFDRANASFVDYLKS